MSNLTADSTYLIKLSAQNEFGMGEFDLYHTEIRTLKSDPTYVPELGVKGITWNSISLGWNSPPEDKVENIMEYITYYKITRQTATEEVRNCFAILHSAPNLNDSWKLLKIQYSNHFENPKFHFWRIFDCPKMPNFVQFYRRLFQSYCACL